MITNTLFLTCLEQFRGISSDEGSSRRSPIYYVMQDGRESGIFTVDNSGLFSLPSRILDGKHQEKNVYYLFSLGFPEGTRT
jgi:hypothetical protein